MLKKLHGKLLSIVLCIAICCATLCGGIIAANAAAADYNGTYTITVGDDKNAVPFGANEVKAQVKFDLPAGFAAGQFTAKAQSSYTIGDTAKVVAITAKDGSALDIADVEVNTKGIDGVNDKMVRFIIADGMGALATSITIEYTLVISDYVSNGTTAQYPVAIEFSEDDLASFALEELRSVKFNKTADSDTWFHSHSAWYSIKNLELNEGKDGKHNVTTDNARCHLCTTSLGLPVEENTITQVLPDYTEFDGVNTPLITKEKIDSAIADSKNDGGPITAWIGVSGVTVRYNDNGALDVDVHVYSRWRTGNNDKVVLLICDKDGNELYRLGPVADGSSYLANNGFPSTEKLFTITGLSAKNLETELLLTAVEYSNGNLEISRTMPFCLADWCENVVTGNSAVWADGATNAQIEADKDVAAALYYYGASIEPNVFDKNTSAGTGSGSTSTIPAPEYINKTTVTWDGEYSSDYPVSNGYSSRTAEEKLANFNAFEATTEGSGNSADDPYIIDTIEEFIYVSQLMGTYSQNKFFKVADTVAQFDFGKWGDGKPKQISLIDNGSHFYGTFDGNGVEFINLIASGYHMALFPNTNAGAVIKNIKLTGATITATQNASAIIANANGGTSTIDGCVVTDCNISGGGYVGVLVGVAGNNNSAVVNNCFVSNNTATTTNTSYRSNHIIGAGGWGTGTLKVNNSIVLVNDAYSWNITCTNVYADEADNTVGVVVTGAGAVDAMGLGSAWFDTNSYPELKAYHTFGVAYVDEATHKTICLHKINGAACKVNLGNESHTLVPNADGSLNVCECGYSEKAVSNIEYIAANYDEWDGTFSQPTAEDTSGNIIITNAEEMAWVALKGGSATSGKSYKVIDNAVFNMNGSTGITLNSTVADVKAATATTNLWNYSADFLGTFDGNGVVIYNIRNATGAAYGGLFPKINGVNSSIKNVTIKASVFYAYHGAGAFVGQAVGQFTTTIDNCVVANCYMTDNNNSNSACQRSAGIFVGSSANHCIKVNNCFASGNECSGGNSYGGFVGRASAWAPGNFTFTNTISLGISPYTTAGDGAIGDDIAVKATWTNVYTDTDLPSGASANAVNGIVKLTAAQMSGAEASANMQLDFASTWFATNGTPELKVFHKMADQYVSETSHKPVCVITVNGEHCTVCGLSTKHVFVKSDKPNEKVCACGYSTVSIGNELTPNNKITVAWDGTKPATLADAGFTTGDGSVGNPYVITKPSQLWYIAQKASADSTGLYYEVAENIGVFDLTNTNWGLADNSCHFQGNFNGNGVKIINFNVSAWNAAVFPNVNGNVSIKNVKVEGATIASSGGNAGGIVACVNGTSSNVLFENCIVVNSTITAPGCSGAISGSGSSGSTKVTIDNVFVSGNTVTSSKTDLSGYSNKPIAGLIGQGWSPANYTVKNSIVLGVPNVDVWVSNFSNVYVDTSVTNASITVVSSLDALKGEKIIANLGNAWFATAGYPELKAFHNLIDVYVDETTHSTVCQDFVNGVQCSVCGVNTEHNLVLNAAGTAEVCSCGISQEVVGVQLKPNHKTVAYWNGGYNANRPATLEASGMKGTGDIDDPYIVETPAQLWYVAQKSGNESAGMYYKVSDSVAVFDLSGDTYGWNLGDNSLRFQGNFDGNGVEIRNFYSGTNGQYHCALFPNVSGNVTISNIKVVNGEIKASAGTAGAIIANVIGTANIKVNNCAVINSTVSSLGTGDSPVGALVGHGGNGANLTIDNCFVSNTTVTTNATSASYPSNCVLGVTWTPANCTISNSIILGCNPENRFGTISNVYTDYSSVTNANITKVADLNTIKGAGTVEKLGLDSNVWFDTNGYPELKAFHDVATIYIDETTHQVVCQIFVNGEQCSVCQAASAHKTVDNAEGTYAECACGYGYEIKGIHAMDIPKAILDRITANSIYAEKFETNDTFKAAYSADENGLDTIYDEFDMYTTSLSLKVSNPHIGFMFAFSDTYKANRGNITVTFTVDGETYTTEAVETNGKLGTNWVNNSGAGRYHLYRFKQLPVAKLCKDITVTVNYNGSNYDFGTYSAAGYAINAMNAGPDYQEHVNAAMALVYYSEMIAARANV